nr:MAG: hypothetical protein [Bacteriophage sp.]
MKIKQLKEKTIKGFIDFLPKVVVNNIEGLSDILNDKLSKSQGGEIKKPIIVTNDDSDYKTIINPDGSIYVLNKNTNNNVFSLINTNKGVIINNNVYSPIRVNNIDALYDKRGNVLYNGTSNIFHANGFAINNGTNKQVLLGDGSTTGELIKQISINNTVDGYRIMVTSINGDTEDTMLSGATRKIAGLMTAPDKVKLDDIPNTYLPLSGGTLTGTLRLNDINSDQNGLDINNVNGIQSVDQYKVLDPEVWTTNGGSIELKNLLKNVAIYVAGGFERVESIDNITVVDSPTAIIFNDRTGRFLASKNQLYYAHWKADISRNIAPPSRYGIETDNGVVPFNNQAYKFNLYSFVYIATCSKGTCSMEQLTLK